jgi:hypothetical protein
LALGFSCFTCNTNADKDDTEPCSDKVNKPNGWKLERKNIQTFLIYQFHSIRLKNAAKALAMEFKVVPLSSTSPIGLILALRMFENFAPVQAFLWAPFWNDSH